jgi:gliding motility-associated protein GldL
MAGVSRRTEVIVNYVVCIGAAIVIFGAWAKILHKSYADIMLTVGLLTEAFIFLVYAFLPPPYSAPAPDAAAAGGQGNPALKTMEKMLAEADITPANLSKLSNGFQRLGSTVDKMGEIGDVVKSTGDFTANTKAAADAMSQVKGAMDKSIAGLSVFNEASESTRQFHGQVQNLTKNLSSLNAIYELELQDTNNHLKAMNKFFGNLTAVSESMQGSVDDAKQAQTQINLLANNLSKLNSVYGNMLSAMQGR